MQPFHESKRFNEFANAMKRITEIGFTFLHDILERRRYTSHGRNHHGNDADLRQP